MSRTAKTRARATAAAVAEGKCSKCWARPTRPGLKWCTECAEATKASHMRGPVVAPPALTRRSLLVVDDRADRKRGPLVERRRAHCDRLDDCEQQWIDDPTTRTSQARCPVVCGGFELRVPREVETPVGCSPGATIGGMA